MDAEHRNVNHANWESRVQAHVTSETYGLDRFRADPDHLSDVVRFDLPRLGSIDGLRAVHLQCHIGTDTLSLARLGATMTGLDFSGSALDAARELAAETGAEIDYVESDVAHAVENLESGAFDLVYTGIGALCWLPDIAAWARTVSELLAPGGRLFIREGHPTLWALDDPRPDGLLALEYPYFEGHPFWWSDTSTYTDQTEEIAAPETWSFNHGLSEIFTALWDAGMTIVEFVEHDSVPWPALGDQMVVDDHGEYRLLDRPERLPLTYTLQAIKSPPLRLEG